MILRSLALTFILSSILSCATTATGRHQLKLISDGQMAQLGDQSYEEVLKKEKTINDPKKVEYVTCVTSALLEAMGEKPKEWKINIFEDKSANAFAVPGKNMGVNSGMLTLATDQAELAAVIGHEIAHVILDHGNERLSQNMLVQGGFQVAQIALSGNGESNAKNQLILAGIGIGAQLGIILPFSRQHETEADLLGQEYMAKAGFDPEGAVTLWKKMAKEGGSSVEFLSTHPSSDKRIEKLAENKKKVEKYYQKADNKPHCHL